MKSHPISSLPRAILKPFHICLWSALRLFLWQNYHWSKLPPSLTVLGRADFFISVRPVYSTIEHVCGLGPREIPTTPSLAGMSGLNRGLFKVAIRVVLVVVITLISIVCPSFDRVMALMGSAFCFTICIVFPCGFYLKMFGDEVGKKEKIVCWTLIVVCSIMAVIGTVWAFLPREITHARGWFRPSSKDIWETFVL